MRRRRLIVVVGALAAAVGAAWWLSFTPLTAAEAQLVGTWQRRQGPDFDMVIQLAADRRWEEWVEGREGKAAVGGGRWTVNNGHLLLDGRPGVIRRMAYRLADLAGIPAGPGVPREANSVALLSVTMDEVVVTLSDGGRETWTRAPTD